MASALSTSYPSQATAELTHIEQALEEWRVSLGNNNVQTDDTKLDYFSQSCGLEDIRPLAVLYPASLDEVKSLVLIANKFQIPLYPFSAGKNWGYGTVAPSVPGSVLVCLSRLNKIIEFNSELAYVVVEPGVTQQQLFEYIEARNLPLSFDVTGSASTASLVGNLSERGSGPSRYADHFLNSAGMEIVLGNGKVLRTGFGHIDNNRTAHIYRWGIGPYLDGIFTQSNFGIITKVGIWLLPKPENFSIMRASFDSDAKLAEAIDKLRQLKLKGILPGAIHIANDLRIISVLQNFPFGNTISDRCLNDKERHILQKRWGVSEWNLLASFEGTHAQIRANSKPVLKALKKLAKVQLCSERLLTILTKLPWLGRIVGQRDLSSKLSVLKLMKGVPSDIAIKGVYWRKQKLPAARLDPVTDKCGVIWCSPIVPMTSEDISRFLKCCREVFSEHSIDTNISVTLLSERACCCTIGIIFDTLNLEESIRAKSCYSKLTSQLVQLGYPPYRLSSNAQSSFRTIYNKDNSFSDVCSKIKSVLDPRGVIAPGKYGITL